MARAVEDVEDGRCERDREPVRSDVIGELVVTVSLEAEAAGWTRVMGLLGPTVSHSAAAGAGLQTLMRYLRKLEPGC